MSGMSPPERSAVHLTGTTAIELIDSGPTGTIVNNKNTDNDDIQICKCFVKRHGAIDSEARSYTNAT